MPDLNDAMSGALSLLNNPNPTPVDLSALNQPLTDPSFEKNAWLAGLFKQNNGDFGTAEGNAYSSLTDAQSKEAQLKASYLPLVAQAQLNQQLQQAQVRNLNLTGAMDTMKGIGGYRQQQMMLPLLQQMIGGQQSPQAPAPSTAPLSQGATAPQSPFALGGGSGGFGNGSGLTLGGMTQLGPQAPQPQGALSSLAPAPAAPMGGGMPISRTQAYALKGLGGPDMTEYFDKAPDIVKLIQSMGIDPSSPQGQQMMQAMFDKQTNIAPIRTQPSGGVYDQKTRTFTTMPAAAPPGFQNVQTTDGTWAQIPVQGGTAAVTSSAAAKASGEAQFELKKVWDPTANGGAGAYTMQSVANIAGAANAPNAPAPLRANNPGALMPNGQLATFPTPQAGIDAADANLQGPRYAGAKTLADVIATWAPPTDAAGKTINNTAAYTQDVANRLGIKPSTPVNLQDPIQRHAILSGIMLHENGPGAVFAGGAPTPPVAAPAVGNPAAAPNASPAGPMMAEPPLGASAGADNLQNNMSKDWASVSADGDQAMTVKNRLQNIANLAPKAITGAETDRRDWLNGILALAGIQGATDAKTASDLVDKNAAQIATALRMGSGNGTDALQSLLQAANPNRHMTVPAINEAVQQLQATQDLNQVRAKVLLPFVTKQDPAGYTTARTQFNAVADPTTVSLGTQLAQLQASGNTAAIGKFVSTLKARPDYSQIKARLTALNGMGAF